jgi:hypothetical protein
MAAVVKGSNYQEPMLRGLKEIRDISDDINKEADILLMDRVRNMDKKQDFQTQMIVDLTEKVTMQPNQQTIEQLTEQIVVSVFQRFHACFNSNSVINPKDGSSMFKQQKNSSALCLLILVDKARLETVPSRPEPLLAIQNHGKSNH